MKKNNRYLIILFVILLIATYFVLKKESGNVSSNEIKEKFVAFDSVMVDKIEILKRSEKIVIEKIAGEWQLTLPIKYTADQDAVLRIISDTKGAKFTSLVSSNPEKQTLFQVDSAGTVVSIFEKGNKRDEFIIGKPGSDYTSTYIRKTNSKDVYLIDKALSFDYGKPLKDWRNKVVFRTVLSSINQVKFAYGDTVFSLSKNQAGWMVDADSVNLTTLQSFLSSLSDINADDFIDNPITLPKLTATINIFCNSQDEIKFYRFEDNSNKYYVQNSKNQQIFILESYNANNILKKKKDFVK
jgi:hypothetical protein